MILFGDGRFSSTYIVLPTPTAEITAPPSTIPVKRGVDPNILAAEKEKKGWATPHAPGFTQGSQTP